MSKRVTESAAVLKVAVKDLKEKFSMMAAVMHRMMDQMQAMEDLLKEKGILADGELDAKVEESDDVTQD